MASSKQLQIVVEPRLLRIGEADVYQLQNISRVSVLEEVRRAPVGQWLIEGFVVLATLGALGDDSPNVKAVAVIALVIAGGLLALSVSQYLNKQPLNVLVIEAGTPNWIVGSRNRTDVHRLMELIVEALRNPPTEAHTQIFTGGGDFVRGDKINQTGIGNIVNGAVGVAR